METIYLDNAATTALDEEVLNEMLPYLQNKYGNASSLYSIGRDARLAVESARKTVAGLLGAGADEIIFTSGGTEAVNAVLTAAVRDLGCKHIITSAIEHHAVLHTAIYLQAQYKVDVSFVKLYPDGRVDLDHLNALLRKTSAKCVVSLMHANNEIGNMINLQTVGELCEHFGAVFHSDTVQTVGHYAFNLSHTPVHLASASGHKFHGPKGTGIWYAKRELKVNGLLQGGGQERNRRAGTENVAGIVGFAKALSIATAEFDRDQLYIRSLKDYLVRELLETYPDINFNGDVLRDSLYTVVNVSLPKTERTETLLFDMDVAGICVSGGSACSSGGSHVISSLMGRGTDRVPLRVSFSKYNTVEDVDRLLEFIKGRLS